MSVGHWSLPARDEHIVHGISASEAKPRETGCRDRDRLVRGEFKAFLSSVIGIELVLHKYPLLWSHCLSISFTPFVWVGLVGLSTKVSLYCLATHHRTITATTAQQRARAAAFLPPLLFFHSRFRSSVEIYKRE